MKMDPNDLMDVNLTQLRESIIMNFKDEDGNRGLIVRSCSSTYNCD